MTVIDDLKKHHELLAHELSEVKKGGLVSEEATKRLFAIKDKLLFHLKMEDEKMYPILREAAKTDERLKEMLDKFDKEMKDVSAAAMDFFNKYKDSTDNPDFTTDIASLIAGLSNRIRKEEMILYKKFEQIAQN